MSLLSRFFAVVLALSIVPSIASAALIDESFEAHEGYSLGDVNGQQGWFIGGNSFTQGDVVAAPAGTPSQLGARSLLLRTDDTLSNDGVTDGLLSPDVAPSGIAGSTVKGQPGNPAVNNSNTVDLWFRTAAASAATSLIPDGTQFHQINLKSDNDRFGRVALFERTGATFSIATDPYFAVDTNLANGDQAAGSNFSRLIAANLNFGDWYRLHAEVAFNPVTPNGELYMNNDMLSIEIFDAAGVSQGSVMDSSTWMAAWYYPQYAGFPDPDAGLNHYAIDGLNFLVRTQPPRGLIPANTPVLYLDGIAPPAPAIPEPAGGLALLGIAGIALMRRRRGC